MFPSARVRYLGSTYCMARCERLQTSSVCAGSLALASRDLVRDATQTTFTAQGSLETSAQSSSAEQEWSAARAGNDAKSTQILSHSPNFTSSGWAPGSTSLVQTCLPPSFWASAHIASRVLRSPAGRSFTAATAMSRCSGQIHAWAVRGMSRTSAAQARVRRASPVMETRPTFCEAFMVLPPGWY